MRCAPRGDVAGHRGRAHPGDPRLARGERAQGALRATFDFDPPVPCDVVATAGRGSLAVEDPVYLDVEGGCACILLDSGVRA